MFRLLRHWNIGSNEEVVERTRLRSDAELAILGSRWVVVKPAALEADKKLKRVRSVGGADRVTRVEAHDHLATRPTAEAILERVGELVTLVGRSYGRLAEDGPPLKCRRVECRRPAVVRVDREQSQLRIGNQGTQCVVWKAVLLTVLGGGTVSQNSDDVRPRPPTRRGEHDDYNSGDDERSFHRTARKRR